MYRQQPSSRQRLFYSPKTWLAGLLLLASVGSLRAQAVAKTTVVEHFTNTVCSICANRNPGFYANLRRQSNVLHIAYHPSSPYRSCVFSQQNPVENDARTNFYGIYGGTPRLVLNGTVIPPGEDYAANALFAPYQGQTSAFAVTVTLLAQGADSLAASVRIQTQAAHSFSAVQLYLALVEDTVSYAAPNREQRHYDVFRRSFTGVNSLLLTPAAVVGGAVTVVRKVYKNPAWNQPRLYAIALVQATGTNELLQAAASPRLSAVVSSVVNSSRQPELQISPNPAGNTISVPLSGTEVFEVAIYNLLGQLVLREQDVVGLTAVDVSQLTPGSYVLRVAGHRGSRYQSRFMKQP